MSNEVMRTEIMEAVNAGKRAIFTLRAAEGKLNSARNWGIFDMLGGGFLINMIKHSNMNSASGYLEEAKRDLLEFQRELKDVQMNVQLDIHVGNFLTFADFFFDGIIADYLVQSKIAEARAQISSAINQVEQIVRDLQSEYDRW